jgi:hypothetical protein
MNKPSGKGHHETSKGHHGTAEKETPTLVKNQPDSEQVDSLVSQASSAYDKPSNRLSQSSILNILSKTVAMYMFLQNLNRQRDEDQP